MCDLTIMIVEPNKEYLEKVCDIFRANGADRLLCVSDAKDAIEYLDGHEDIDILVIADELPDRKGIEVLDKISREHPSIQCVFTQDTNDSLAGLKARARGAKDFIRKAEYSSVLLEVIPPLIHELETYYNVVGTHGL